MDQVALKYLQVYLDRQPVRKYKKGEIITFQGEVPRHAFAVKSGIVKSYNLSASGNEKPVTFYPKNYVFPIHWIYGKAPSSVYYYEAFTPETEIYLLNRDNYVSFVKRSRELLYQEMEKILVDQLGGSMRLNALQQSKAMDKLLYTLHYLSLTHGRLIDDNLVEIDLALTHQDFANLTGLTRETAATELSKLKKQGIIAYGKHTTYTIDLNKLMQKINDQFISDLNPAMLLP